LQPGLEMIWDPGGVEDSENGNLYKRKVPIQIYIIISTMSGLDVEDEMEYMEDENSRTELDSHANMPVIGRNAYIISDTGMTAGLSPFTPDYSSMRIKIVDAAVQYDCPYQGTTHILVIRNALHAP
jgi:hypothetical protein